MIHPDEVKYVFVNGKGGVGKTTVAASLAVKWAKQKRRCLLVSTDPAHNLGDLFECNFQGNKIQRITDNLDGLEIDTDRETQNYITSVKQRVRNIVDPELIQEAYRHIDMAAQSPGAEEAALLQRFVGIILDLKDDYDNIIFDTAPSGHTLRLLALPDIMGNWMEGMLSIRQSLKDDRPVSDSKKEDDIEDPVLNLLARRKERLHRVHDQLIDDKAAEFLLVALPEQVPLAETARIYRMLRKYGFSVRYLIINKMVHNSEGSNFLEERKREQEKALKSVKGELDTLERVDLPYFAREPIGYDSLMEATGYLDYSGNWDNKNDS